VECFIETSRFGPAGIVNYLQLGMPGGELVEDAPGSIIRHAFRYDYFHFPRDILLGENRVDARPD
jgi:hypothetical protein